MKAGKLIVIDGADGSGKATQTALLVKNLRKAGYKVKAEDFPQYGQKSAGAVEDYLAGRYGSAVELGPYIPSTFYAIDRFAAAGRVRDNLKKGMIVVSNRYVTASMGHQGGKIADKKNRDKYFKWLEDLEYNFYGIPKPDLNLILHMPPRVAQRLLGKKRDLHEADPGHLKAASAAYVEISKKFKYPLIECYENGRILRRKDIAAKIWQITRSKLKV